MVAATSTRPLEFTATVHRSKNKMVTIPAAIARRLGLERGRTELVVDCLIRPRGSGRWREHLAYLTSKHEFRVLFAGGSRVDVCIRRVISVSDVELPKKRRGADVLVDFPEGDDPRTDGSINVDHYLYGHRKKSR